MNTEQQETPMGFSLQAKCAKCGQTEWYHWHGKCPQQQPQPAIGRCPVCGVWDGKGSKHDDDCLNG